MEFLIALSAQLRPELFSFFRIFPPLPPPSAEVYLPPPYRTLAVTVAVVVSALAVVVTATFCVVTVVVVAATFIVVTVVFVAALASLAAVFVAVAVFLLLFLMLLLLCLLLLHAIIKLFQSRHVKMSGISLKHSMSKSISCPLMSHMPAIMCHPLILG